MRQSLFLNFKECFIFLLFFICWFFPFNLDYQVIKNIKTSLKVKVKRNSPPLIALADANIKPSFEIQQHSLLNNNAQMRDTFVPIQGTTSKKQILSSHILHIKKPLLISSKSVEKKTIKAKPLKILHLKGIKLFHSQAKLPVSQASKDIMVSSSPFDKNTFTNQFAKSIKLDSSIRQPSDFERRWLAYTQSLKENSLINIDTSSDLSLSANTSSPISKEENQSVNGTALFPQQKWVSRNVWVGLPHQEPSTNPWLIASSKGSSNNKRDSNNAAVNEQQETTHAAMMSLHQSKSSIKVVGKITLSKGLALLESDDLSIIYIAGCSVEKMADIDLNQGRFSVDIEGPDFGFLLAQLRGKDGLLRGSSQILLRDVFIKKFSENPNFAIRDSVQIDLQITPLDRPTMQVFRVDEGHRDILSKALEVKGIGKVKSDKDGLFYIPELLAGSSFIAKALTQGVSTQNLWKALFWSANDKNYEWEIPNNTLLKNLQNHLSDLSPDLSVIWGKVLKNGQPIQGISLELALADQIGKPYYLTPEGQFIKGGTTTSTGYFVYANVPPGIQTLRASGEDFSIPAQVLWTDRGHISSVVLEDTKKEVKACIFDSQTGDFLSAYVNFLGLSTDNFETQSGHLDLKLPNNNLPLHFELLPKDMGYYYPILLTSHLNKPVIPFPVPRRSWIDELAAKYKITQHPDLSIIVGHISHSSFKVYIENTNRYTDIVYFNRNENSQEPLPSIQDGGFVLFNVDPGLHSLVLETEHLEKGRSIKTLITDSDFVTVFSHSF